MRFRSTSPARSIAGILAASLLACAAGGCSAEGATDATASSDGAAARPPEGDLGVDLRLLEGAKGSTLDAATACATGIAESKPLPAVVQMVIDTSGSMSWPPGYEPKSSETPPRGVESKWDITKAALARAVAELPGDAWLGMNFYPNVAHGSTRCVKNEVALGLSALGANGSSQRGRFHDGLERAQPRGGTPTHSAYRFGLDTLGAKALQGNGFVVLITDGVPTYTASCAGDGIAAVDSAPLIAEAAAALERGIRTFVIGSPGSEPARAALSRVAEAGGTPAAGCSHEGPRFCHFDMTTQAELGAALEGALSDISSELPSCDYAIPEMPSGKALDLDRVNVLRTSSSGTIEVLPRGDGDCAEGWVYSSDRRRIVLCERTCAAARSDPSSRVEVLFGCETETVVPR